MAAKKVWVLGTGGTIAGTGAAPNALAYTSAQLGIETLLQGVPGLPALLLERQLSLVVEQVAQIDSKDMVFGVWVKLAQQVVQGLSLPEVAGVVITHGTDTLEETAYFLHHVLPAELLARKPVVITCAMRPATSREADGPQNLKDAIFLATHPGACGVVTVCAGQIHGAVPVQKVHPYRLDAFDSGDAGHLGNLLSGSLVMEQPWPRAGGAGLSATANPEDIDLAALVQLPVWPRVEIVLSHAGATGDLVDTLVDGLAVSRAVGGVPVAHPVRGIVVAGTGNGTVHHTLQAALVRAQTAGIRVWRTTRCAYGAVQDAQRQPLPEASTLTPVKARIALMLELVAEDARRVAGAAQHETGAP